MKSKLFAGIAAALTFAMTASLACAMGPITVGSMGGGAFGSSGSAMRRITVPPPSASRDRGGAINGAVPSLNNVTFPTNDPDHYHEIKLIGRLAKDESGLAIDQQTVLMRVDGRTIPMAIDGDAISNNLRIDQGDELGQTLYRLILSRQLQVVGDKKLRDEIFKAAAANPSNARPIEVDGFVYDRATPYLVLVSVDDAK